MKTRELMVGLAVATALLLSCPAVAEEVPQEDKHGEEHSSHANLIGVFMGMTSNHRREGSFTLGLEYNRRFTKHFGMGLLAENVFADEEFNVYAVGFAYYFSPWKVYVAPGVERSDAHGSEFLVRLGVEYAFDIAGFEVAPQVDVDFVDGEEVFVFGITFGKGF
jgi:hypothetical protein